MRHSITARVVLCVAGATLGASLALPAQRAYADVSIIGAGSTWSANIVKQWVADVNKFGITINFSDIGATAGRQLFLNNQSDFAVSPIPFQPDETPILASRNMTYSYLPIAAGGTAFMYNLRGVSDLKVSQRTAAKIFTGQITQWNRVMSFPMKCVSHGQQRRNRASSSP